ncbi:MAG TPA: chemotaxis protein CheB [Gemmatimonadales bacterium]|nr:chemotaxis protein CheB [Gemmatimonadales bacterium]
MPDQLVVIGGSAGAVEALAHIVRGLPPDLAAAVAVVVHFPETTTSILPNILRRSGSLPAAHATDGEAIRPGQIYVAPPGHHLLVADGHFRLSRGPRENGARPAVDPLFRSAAQALGPQVIGLVLTGNLDDGTLGLAAIQQCGGTTIAQDPATANFPGMPASAIAHVPVDYVVPLDAIAAQITALVAAAPKEEAMSPESTGGDAPLGYVPKPDNQASGFTCPECHGALWEQQDGSLVHYECRVGHAYSAESLLSEHADDLEEALWSAYRTLLEHAAIARRLAEAAAHAGHKRSASAYTERAVDCEHHAAVIRRTVERMDVQLAHAPKPAS